MINKVYKDEPLVFLEDTVVDAYIKANMQKYVMLCFPSVAMVEEETIEIEEMGHRVKDDGFDEDGWTTITPKWRMRVEKRRVGESLRDDRSFREVVSCPKRKWVARADLVQDWKRAGKGVDQDQGVRSSLFNSPIILNYVFLNANMNLMDAILVEFARGISYDDMFTDVTYFALICDDICVNLRVDCILTSLMLCMNLLIIRML